MDVRMNETYGMALVRQFFPGTGTTYDHIANLCTIGFDRQWKRRMMEKIPLGSTHILDQACGTGILTFRMAEKFPRCRVVGVDVSAEYLAIAREKARSKEQENVDFIQGRAEDVLLDESFDCITSSYLAKYAELGRLAPNMQAMLRSGGMLVMHDFTYPPNHAFALLWEFYFKLLQTIGAWRYPAWRAAFDGLPGLIRETPWVDNLARSLQQHGFSGITVEPLTLGTSAIVTARKD
jgi:demethylmenaquinone methyltransferase/2-methoxy-6-polyprenyl-1,4-benzoquinol methylase